MPGEASNVHLVDDHVLHLPAKRLISLPVVVMNVDDDAAHGSCQIIGRSDGVVACKTGRGIARGIRVDQHLVAVEAKASAVEVLWSVDTVRVMGAWFKAFDINVPEKERLINGGLQLDDLDRPDVVMRVEEKEFDAGGMPGKDREINPLLVDGGAEWVCSAWPCLVRSLRCRWPNIGLTRGHYGGRCHGGCLQLSREAAKAKNPRARNAFGATSRCYFSHYGRIDARWRSILLARSVSICACRQDIGCRPILMPVPSKPVSRRSSAVLLLPSRTKLGLQLCTNLNLCTNGGTMAAPQRNRMGRLRRSR